MIESAKARQREAEANVLTARADIDAAKAKLQVAQSEIAQAETMLTYTELAAPFDGLCNEPSCRRGALCSAGRREQCTATDDDCKRCESPSVRERSETKRLGSTQASQTLPRVIQ